MADKGAIVKVCLRTKTTKRAMPFAFLISDLTGSATASWATRYVSVLRQAVADTLAAQPDRTLDFLPTVTAGPVHRPTLSRPLKRDLAVPRLLSVIHTFWRFHILLLQSRLPTCTVSIRASRRCWRGAASSVCPHLSAESRGIIICLARINLSSYMAEMMPSVRCNRLQEGLPCPLEPALSGDAGIPICLIRLRTLYLGTMSLPLSGICTSAVSHASCG